MPKSDARQTPIENESSRIITLTFSNQTTWQHFVGVIGGITLWYFCYAGYLAMIANTGDVVWSSMTTVAVQSRATAATLATFACGIYFGILIVKGVGGPVLNLLYAGSTVVVLPRVLHHLIGQVPEGYFTDVSPVSRIAFRAVWVEIVLPGMLAVLVIPVLWFILVCQGDTKRREWVRRNIPEFLPEDEY